MLPSFLACFLACFLPCLRNFNNVRSGLLGVARVMKEWISHEGAGRVI
ncbi:MAG: hypothetical protein ACTSUE_08910 [Promethearchaeota archaeon]